MTRWKFKKEKEIGQLKNCVLIEGLPGIGNVGKIVADFIIDELKAEKIYDIFGHSMPNSVFVNEDNLVELPRIEIYHVTIKDRDFLILTGDVQPIDEESSYEFCEDILRIGKEHELKQIVTLGGIGLGEEPKQPKVYCTGNNKEIVNSFKEKSDVKTDIHGIVGPIMGVSGLLLGIAQKEDVNAACLLAETYGHPMYLGVKGARAMLEVLKNVYKLDIDTKKLDKEILQLDKEMKKTEDISKVSKKFAKDDDRMHYIE